MRTFWVFVYVFAIISSVINEAQLQDLSTFLQVLGGGGDGEGGGGGRGGRRGNMYLLKLLKQAMESGQEPSENTPYIMEGGNNPIMYQLEKVDYKSTLAPPVNKNQSFLGRTRDTIIRYWRIWSILFLFLVQMLRVGFQMIFRGLILSAGRGDLTKIIRNNVRLWIAIARGFIKVFPGMVWDTLTNFLPSLLWRW